MILLPWIIKNFTQFLNQIVRLSLISRKIHQTDYFKLDALWFHEKIWNPNLDQLKFEYFSVFVQAMDHSNIQTKHTFSWNQRLLREIKGFSLKWST